MPDRLPQVLLLDDTPAKRYILARWLRRDGYRVIEAGTIAEARTVLRERPVELAVLDVNLPDGNGLDLMRVVKADPSTSGIPVVHVSAVAVDTVDKVAGLDGGADAYFIDPIEPEEFLSTIRALLRSSGARRDAELLARRLSHLNRAAVRLNVASSTARLADAVASAASEVLDAPAVAVLVAEGIAHRSSVAPGRRVESYDEVSADSTHPVLGEVESLATVFASERPWRLVLPVTGPPRWRVRSVRVSSEQVGLLAVPVSESQAGDDFLLDRLAQLTSVAFDNIRSLEREHRNALVLQRSLLPTVLPRPRGLTVAARYRASELHAEVGGDFFDAFEVDGDCVVAIGDVQGHSLEAAVVMAELRYTMRAYAYEGHDPEAVMNRIDRVLVREEQGVTATAIIARIDAERRSMQLVRAGHTPAFLVREGRARLLEPRGILLGLGSSHPQHHYDLLPGDLLVLITDGLVERRVEDMHESLDRVARTVENFDGDVDDLADHLLHQRAADRREPLSDDIAILVVRVG